MYNWSTSTKGLSQNTKKHTIWRLESLINFGLNHSKIDTKSLKDNLEHLDIEDKKKNFLKFLLK